MTFTIKQFTFSSLLFLILAMYTLFANYFFSQRDLTASVITTSIQNDISELAYVISKQIKKEPVFTVRALLDRKAANSDYINAIAIFDDNKLLVTTDPRFSQSPNVSEAYVSSRENAYSYLKNTKIIEEDIRYYVGHKLKTYRLLLLIDQDFIQKSFEKKKKKFIILFAIFPIFMVFLFWFSLRRFIISPMESLRQYAYYQSKVPSKLRIKELEYVRASMVQTFTRLEQERTELYKLARTDSLSGLANRNHLQERVEQIIAESKRSHKEFALLFLDLDHFKSVNDSLGHDVGDELLKKVAKSIENILRTNDIVARVGGDEFVIVLTRYKDEIELIDIINRIQVQLMKPWQVKTYPIHITSSIGITLYPKDGTDLLTLMKNADIAMYEAKEKGRRGYHFFTEELNNKTQEYIELTNEMHHALKNNEYELYYQPQNSVQTGEIIGAEALIRWSHPEQGMIAPFTFIPIAEHNGFILELGKWILENSIKQKKEWEDKGMDLKLSINVAAKQIQQDDFVTHLKLILETYQVNTSKVFLEITEYSFLHDSASVYNTFKEIKALGVQISLDDFGTGYSSLSYLKTFPIDVLKIDKAFLDDYDTSDGAVFIETIINMANTLRIEVVAEGVETYDQVEYLKSLRCQYYQGYVCSRPVTVDVFEMLYKEQKCLTL